MLAGTEAYMPAADTPRRGSRNHTLPSAEADLVQVSRCTASWEAVEHRSNASGCRIRQRAPHRSPHSSGPSFLTLSESASHPSRHIQRDRAMAPQTSPPGVQASSCAHDGPSTSRSARGLRARRERRSRRRCRRGVCSVGRIDESPCSPFQLEIQCLKRG